MNKERGFPFQVDLLEGRISALSSIPKDYYVPLNMGAIVDSARKVIEQFSFEVLENYHLGRAVFGTTALTTECPDERAVKLFAAKRVVKDLMIAVDPLSFYDGARGNFVINPLIACNPLPVFAAFDGSDVLRREMAQKRLERAMTTVIEEICRNLVLEYFGIPERVDCLECRVPVFEASGKIVEVFPTNYGEVFLAEFYDRPPGDGSVKERFCHEVLLFIPHRIQRAMVMLGALRHKEKSLINPFASIDDIFQPHDE